MPSPSDRRYSDSHEWHRLDDGLVTIGLSRFAVDELTDITFVELPDEGETFEQGDPFGEIESVKATSELYTFVSGKVVETNDALEDNPGVVNEDPYEAGWLIKIDPSDVSQLDELMDAESYDKKYPAG